MDLTNSATFLPLLAAGSYIILLVVLLTRQQRQGGQISWLSRFLAISIVWQLAWLPSPLHDWAPNLPAVILLVGTLALGMTTAVYVDWPRHRQWLYLGGVTVIALFVADLIWPAPLTDLPQPLPAAISLGGALAPLLWLILSGTLLVTTWRNYQANRMPWHANRLLYWAVTLLITFTGELLLFLHEPSLIIAGQATRLFGAVGLAYGVSSHRLFDVRSRLRLGLSLLLMTAVASILSAAALLLVIQLIADLELTQQIVFLVGVAAVGFLLYQPFRQQAERIIRRFVALEAFDTGAIIRAYSEAISQTLDVEQLSLLIIGTLSEMLETSRGALYLLTEVDGRYEIEPIPAMGRISRRKVQFERDSLLFESLTRLRQPLLQYEVDFNPEFADLPDAERQWLQEQEMDVFVPVQTGQRLTSLIALGPKSSGNPLRPNELELVQMLADQTIIALQNARLYSELGAHNEQIRQLNTDLRLQNQRLEIMDKVKSDFITIASHELRTPLTQVKGYTDILAAMNEETSLPPEQAREIIGHINRGAAQLEHVISAMLDASQIDVNAMRLTFVETRMDTIIRLAVEPLSRAIRQRRLNLLVEGVKELPTIRADFKRLVQAFSNLIGNAVKYTPDGGTVNITAIQAVSDDPEAGYVEIVIADTGIGIDSKYHELIFEKFFRVGDPQLHSTSSTKFKGAGPGLGLPIARGVVEAHGGRIWVESEGEDEKRLPGSRFGVILPIVPPQAKVSAPPPADKSERPPWLIG
jgi:signal transduction histidine kinase